MKKFYLMLKCKTLDEYADGPNFAVVPITDALVEEIRSLHEFVSERPNRVGPPLRSMFYIMVPNIAKT